MMRLIKFYAAEPGSVAFGRHLRPEVLGAMGSVPHRQKRRVARNRYRIGLSGGSARPTPRRVYTVEITPGLAEDAAECCAA